MRTHFRRWGAVYLLAGLFMGSWLGQLFTQIAAEARQAQAQGGMPDWDAFWPKFWGATFENWQSEWLQLLVQAAVLLGMKHLIFKADAEDFERMDAKLDRLFARAGYDVDQVNREICLIERGHP